jgi:hypothetical protein
MSSVWPDVSAYRRYFAADSLQILQSPIGVAILDCGEPFAEEASRMCRNRHTAALLSRIVAVEPGTDGVIEAGRATDQEINVCV